MNSPKKSLPNFVINETLEFCLAIAIDAFAAGPLVVKTKFDAKFFIGLLVNESHIHYDINSSTSANKNINIF